MKEIKREIIQMANEIAKHYTWEGYIKLSRACEEEELFWCEQTNEETHTFEFWIEDEHWTCEED